LLRDIPCRANDFSRTDAVALGKAPVLQELFESGFSIGSLVALMINFGRNDKVMVKLTADCAEKFL
jgi:hypothetical protein